MDVEEFRKRGKEMVDYICDLQISMPSREVYPDVKPGYLQKHIPEEPPENPEPWEKIIEDTDKYIVSGITYWQHPQFFAYFPHGASYPSLLADMIVDGLGIVPFSWVS
jgi:tyrosine decarboxylase